MRNLKTWLIALLSLNTACATFSGTKQKLKVVTEPAGVEILHEGESLGTSPAFIKVRRRKSSQLQFRFPDGKIETVAMESRYRWVDSLIGNMAWLSVMTPVGWAVDILNESAWDYKSLSTLRLKTKIKTPVREATPLYAIAPPQTKYEALSEESAEWLENNFCPGSLKCPFEILPYSEASVNFERYDYLHSSPTAETFREDLYYDLQADVLVESEVIENEDTNIIKTKSIDVYSGNVLNEREFVVPSRNFEFSQRGSLSRLFSRWTTVIPNTGGVEFGSKNPGITTVVDNQQARSRLVADQGIGQYLQAIYLSSSSSAHRLNRFAVHFEWVPAVSASQYRLRYLGLNGEEISRFGNTTFEWWQVFVGIGPQVGLSSPVGFFYVGIPFGVAQNWISYKKGPNEANVNGLEPALRAELGWAVFISRNISLKLVTRTVPSSQSLWSRALSRASGRAEKVTDNQVSFTGLSFNYFFPEGRRFVRSLF